MRNMTTVMGSHMRRTTITLSSSTLTTLRCLLRRSSSCCDSDPLGPGDMNCWLVVEIFLVHGITRLPTKLSSLSRLVGGVSAPEQSMLTGFTTTHGTVHRLLVDRSFWKILW